MTRRVILAPEAESDLNDIYDYVAGKSGEDRAFGFLERILDYLESFDVFPERGQMRNDLRTGLRVVGFERRITVAFHVASDAVVIDRVLYGGRDLAAAFDEDA